MMKVTFLAHSGFFVELDNLCLLFDWWKGELPPLPDKPLFVFASHAHSDHFTPAIFSLDRGHRAVSFLLGSDIALTPRRMEKWGISRETADKCRCLHRGETVSLPDLTVEVLRSTDEGEAFLVTAERYTIFHAGDLNWWHWEGEPDPWNPEMARSFREYAEPLRGRRIDLAMLPLDPRLGEDGFRGPKYFLELAEIDRFLPMHQWNDYGFTDRFLTAYPQFAAQTMPIIREGQCFSF